MEYPTGDYGARSSDAIVCNRFETEFGWRVQVVLPKNVPARDRIAMLKWIASYEGTVKRQNPAWGTCIHGTNPEYFLDIRPAKDAGEGIAKAILSAQERAHSGNRYG